MQDKIKELVKDYEMIVRQSHIMEHSLSDPVDRAKVEGGRISIELAIEHLGEILNSNNENNLETQKES